MDTVIRVQILDVDVFISHNANILVKGMNPTIFSPEIGKQWNKQGILRLKANSELKRGKFL